MYVYNETKWKKIQFYANEIQKGQVDNSTARRQKIAFWQLSRMKPLNKRYE